MKRILKQADYDLLDITIAGVINRIMFIKDLDPRDSRIPMTLTHMVNCLRNAKRHLNRLDIDLELETPCDRPKS